MSDLSPSDEPLNLFDYENIQEDVKSVLLCLAELDRSVSMSLLTAILQGRKTKSVRQSQLYKLSTYGDLSNCSSDTCFNMYYCLLDQGYLRAKRQFNDYLAISLSGKGLNQLIQPQPIFLIPYEYTAHDLRLYEQKIDQYDQLIHVRKKLYNEKKKTCQNFKLFQIAKNEELKELVSYPPATERELAERFDWSLKDQKAYLSPFFKVIRNFKESTHERV